MVNFDFWYNDTIKEVAYITCSFSDIDCVYRGNLYDINKKCIGDYNTKNSAELEKIFHNVFN